MLLGDEELSAMFALDTTGLEGRPKARTMPSATTRLEVKY